MAKGINIMPESLVISFTGWQLLSFVGAFAVAMAAQLALLHRRPMYDRWPFWVVVAASFVAAAFVWTVGAVLT